MNKKKIMMMTTNPETIGKSTRCSDDQPIFQTSLRISAKVTQFHHQRSKKGRRKVILTISKAISWKQKRIKI